MISSSADIDRYIRRPGPAGHPMTCKVCRERIHPKDHGGWYHVQSWVELTADHQAEPVNEAAL